MSEQRRLAYLCLQATHEGQASYAHVHEIISGLERRGWSVSLRQPGYAGRSGGVSVPRRIAAHLTVPLAYIRDLRRAEAAYVRDHPMALPGVVFASLMGRPCVLEVNGPYDELPQSYPWTRRLLPVLRWSFLKRARLSAHVIVVTDQLKEWAEAQGIKTPVSVVTNGADIERFVPATQDAEKPEEPYVIFVGALARWQGVDTLLDAVESPEWPAGMGLKVAGDGVMRDAVEEIAARHERVEYLGRVAYADVPELLARGQASLIPKNTMGDRAATGLAPLKLFEAMAAGVPVVVSDIPGQADLVRDEECGIVVPPEDPKALAEAVKTLAEEPQQVERLGANGRTAAEERYSWDFRAEDTRRILQGLLEEPDMETAEPMSSDQKWWEGCEAVQVLGGSAYGGGVPVILNVMSVTESLGMEPTLLATDPVVVEAAEADGRNVWEFPGIVRRPQPVRDLIAAWRLSRALKKRGVRIVHSHTSKGGMVGRLAGRLAGCDVVIHHTHGFYQTGMEPGVARSAMTVLERGFGRLSDAQVLINTHEYQDAVSSGIVPAESAQLVFNGIADPTEGEAVDCEGVLSAWGVPEGARVIGTVGRIELEQKGLEAGVETFSAVAKRVPEAHWVVAGTGPDSERLDEMIEAAGLTERVHAVGHVEDARSKLGCFDAIFAPSRREGQSITVLEAMAHGVPVVTTRIPGTADLVDDGVTGVLCTVDNAAAMANALVDVLSDESRAERMGSAARRKYEETFTLEVFRENMRRAYLDILERGPYR